MILVGGENLIDFIQLDENAPPMSYQANAGGSPFNCAKALGHQGVECGFLTPISTDSLGDLLADALTDANVSLLAPRDPAPTSLAVVSIDAGIPSYQFYREQTAERNVTLAALEKATPEGAKALCIGSLALTGGADADAWADYFCTIKSKGVFTALDPNIRAAFIHNRTEFMARLDRVMASTDLLKLSDEDLEWLIPATDLDKAAAQLLAQSSAKLLVVTMGEHGAFALTKNHKVTIKPAKVRALRDTVGAGDTFTATLLAQLLKNNFLDAQSLEHLDAAEIESLLKWAANAAALNCEQDGCNPPSAHLLETRMGPNTGPEA